MRAIPTVRKWQNPMTELRIRTATVAILTTATLAGAMLVEIPAAGAVTVIEPGPFKFLLAEDWDA